MKTEITTKASRLVSNIGFSLKKHSPTIFMGLGIVGTVASTVIACKATTKIGSIIEEKNKTINDIHEVLADPEMKDKYTEEDSKKDLTIVYTQTGIKLLKLYAPAIALGTLSIASIIMGQRILNKRNAALASAYMAVDQGFKRYRKNVVERFGEQVDKELRYNIKAKTIEDPNKKGKDKTEEVLVVENPNDEISEYAKFFDENTSSEYQKDPEYNLMFLRRQQDWANEKLKNKGHLFLNEVYDMLGIPRTKAGQIVGWLYDPNNKDTDSYVSFGIYDPSKELNRRFVGGLERTILLDFNVDGPIYESI